MKRHWYSAVAGAALTLVLVACNETPTSSAPASAAAPVDRKAGQTPDAGVAPDAGGNKKVDFQEIEFGESERSRDPFRSFLSSFVDEARSQAKSQRQVVLDEYAIDELKLVGIVSGVADPRAMVVDPRGQGHVLQRGQFVGRAEVVHGDSQGAPAYEVNWRVDRVRDSDVVLVREDPKNPEVPSATRVIQLHPEGELKSQNSGVAP